MLKQPSQIFISYAQADVSFARRLSKELNSGGWNVLLDENLSVGPSTRALEKALRAADLYLVLLSKESVVSPSVNFELGVAMAQSKPVIPIYLSRGVLRDVPEPLKAIQGISAENQTPREVAERVTHTMERRGFAAAG